MKHTIKKLAALALALLLLVASLVGCTNHGQTMMEVGKYEISVNVYQLYLSRMRGSLSLAGDKVNDENYWKSYRSTSGETIEDYYNRQVFAGLKQIAAALYLYDELGLKLDKELEREIDEWIDTLVEEIGGGSQAQLNAYLAPYGANITVLRDAALIEARIDQLKTHLYGENGSLLTAMAKEEFYRATYYRGYQMLVANTYYKHDRFEGRSVYYTKDGNHIAYDTVNGVATDEIDDKGDVRYRLRNEDGTLGEVAYDKENGSIRYYTDKDGAYIIENYSDEEIAERYETLEAIAEDCKNNPARYLEYAEKWSDNSAFNEKYAPNGMYFSAGTYTTDEVFGTFATEFAKLEVGELAILESSAGYYLIMRVELDDGAWQNSENSQWFSTLTGLCVEYMLQERTKEYLQYVSVDEALRDSVSIAQVGTNTAY